MFSNYRFKDNTDIILEGIENATKKSIKKMAKIGVDSVQYQMLYGYNDPHGKDGHTEIVDTEKLFDSIKGKAQQVSQNAYTVIVGTNVKYAVYVHNGTYKLKARRFITDGIMRAQEDMKKAMIDSYQDA